MKKGKRKEDGYMTYIQEKIIISKLLVHRNISRSYH